MWRWVWFFCGFTMIAWADTVNTAKQLSAQIQEKTNTGAKVNTNLAQPLMTKDPLSTFDGRKSFDAQLMCQSTNQLMTMNLQPLATGDIRITSIAQDTDMDGTLDAYLTPSWIISGVCANGFVQCTPGTWDNCASYRWTLSDDHMVAAERVGFTDLGGCYCINNHCGNQLAWSNLSNILEQLGMGAMSGLVSRHAFYAIADSKIDGTSIIFYGQNAQTCEIPTRLGSDTQARTLGPAATDLLRYNNNPQQLSQDATNNSSSSDLYQRLLTSQFNQDGEVEYAHCNINRVNTLNQITLNDVISLDSGVGGVSTDCGSDCIRLTLGRVGDDYWGGWCALYHHHTSFFVNRPERIISATLKRAKWDDWIQVVVDGIKIWSGPRNNWNVVGSMPPGACELSTSWDRYPNVDFTQAIKHHGQVNFDVNVEVTGGGEGYAFAEVRVDTACYLNPEEIVDGCTVYQHDSECDLFEETVDGVMTYHDKMATGLSPLSSSRNITGAACTIAVNKPWFQKQRTYLCRRHPHYNLDNALNRTKYLRQHVDSAHYHDQPYDAQGNLLGTHVGNMTLINPIDVPNCTHVCKTRKPKPKTEAALSGVTGDRLNVPTQYEFSYRVCGTDDSCPAQLGEEIIKTCQCLNEFAEATAIMQTLRLAGQDIICSTGQPQLLR